MRTAISEADSAGVDSVGVDSAGVDSVGGDPRFDLVPRAERPPVRSRATVPARRSGEVGHPRRARTRSVGSGTGRPSADRPGIDRASTDRASADRSGITRTGAGRFRPDRADAGRPAPTRPGAGMMRYGRQRAELPRGPHPDERVARARLGFATLAAAAVLTATVVCGLFGLAQLRGGDSAAGAPTSMTTRAGESLPEVAAPVAPGYPGSGTVRKDMERNDLREAGADTGRTPLVPAGD